MQSSKLHIVLPIAFFAAFLIAAIFGTANEDLRRERIHAVLMEEAPSMAATLRVIDQAGLVTVIELTDLSYNTCKVNVMWTDNTLSTIKDFGTPYACRNETQ